MCEELKSKPTKSYELFLLLWLHASQWKGQKLLHTNTHTRQVSMYRRTKTKGNSEKTAGATTTNPHCLAYFKYAVKIVKWQSDI